MDATGGAPAKGVASGETQTKLLREPLFWAAAAAFVGTALGVFGLVWQSSLRDALYVDPSSALVWQVLRLVGGALVAASSLGVVCLLWNGLRRTRKTVLLGLPLIALLLAAYALGAAYAVYWSTGERLQGYAESPFPTLEAAAFYGTVFLPPVVLLLFAAGSLASHERRLGILLAALCLVTVPYGVLGFLLSSPDSATYVEPEPLIEVLLVLLGWFPVGISLPQAPLWVLLGVMLLRRARSRTSDGTFRIRESANLKAARRLYAGGLANGDASIVDELVSEGFRDLGRGSRGKLAMERVFAAPWKSYPDLTVSIQDQQAEGDLVRTRLTLSGTDRGGVLWYPPTGRHATFTALFTDRFLDGQLIEHAGETDTRELLSQLGLAESQPGTPPPADQRAESEGLPGPEA